MDETRNCMMRLTLVTLGALGALLYVAGAAAEPPGPDPAIRHAPLVNGMMVDQDPSAGELGAPPAEALPPGAASQEQGPAPVEVPGTTPGGGWKVKGPFVYRMEATTGPDGNATIGCVPGCPGE